MKIICPRCEGKGHIVDLTMMVFVPVVSWFIGWLEQDDPESLTRNKCPRCNGKGMIKFIE